MKPRIKWWGNGDVHMGCFNAYRLCYPNDIATFRTDFIPISSTVHISKLKVGYEQPKK